MAPLDGIVDEHARHIAAYMSRTMAERDYRRHQQDLQRRITRERYREIHEAALTRIGERYLRAD